MEGHVAERQNGETIYMHLGNRLEGVYIYFQISLCLRACEPRNM